MTESAYHTPEKTTEPDATVWTERTYTPWGVSNAKSRKRAKRARQRAMGVHRAKKLHDADQAMEEANRQDRLRLIARANGVPTTE